MYARKALYQLRHIFSPQWVLETGSYYITQAGLLSVPAFNVYLWLFHDRPEKSFMVCIRYLEVLIDPHPQQTGQGVVWLGEGQ